MSLREMKPMEIQTTNFQPITVVSGLPRSGTSMMMQMLAAGGMEILTDHIRKADDDNSRGYYELEGVKRLAKDQSILQSAPGKAVKIISELLRQLSADYTYQVIFMKRNMSEILASQKQMLIRRGKPVDAIDDQVLSQLFEKHLKATENWLKQQSNFRVLYVHYNQIWKNPKRHVEDINRFLDFMLDEQQMLSVLDEGLYRQRR